MAPIGGLLALLITHTHFSVSSGVGFLALFGVSVQTGVIMLEYINQLRARGRLDPGCRRGRLGLAGLRPIMMTMLVASLGLLPAALSRGIGSDSQRPFAIVIVGGLMGALSWASSCCRPFTSGLPAIATPSRHPTKSSRISSLCAPPCTLQ